LLALVVAPAAMLVTKGGRAHITWGRIYFWAMFATNLVAIWLLFWRFNTFLFGVVALSLHSAATGYRAIYRKGGQVRWFDWGITGTALVTAIGMILWGALTGLGLTEGIVPSGGMGVVAAILPIVFGLAIFGDARTDLGLYRKPSPDRRWWWYYHMERMLGSYLGLLTALMVQQVGPRLPDSLAWTAWVAPTLIGTPLIVIWIKQYRRKFAKPAASLPQGTLHAS
jgi:hypothetical protein